ncbi:MAG TPA: ABC transporter ATP-binding protein [Syntrophorhabdales bacterium]|nr:ABC transporter ATP-binding protein [Syntrophorhabdales bacterium]
MHHSVELLDIHVSVEGSLVLRGVSVEAKPCEFVAISGANGAGKTTLLKVINGTLTPDSGRVTVLHQDLMNHPNPNLLRREIAFVPQKTNHHRFPLRVGEAVLMGRYGKIGLIRRPTGEDRAKADDAMRLVGILPFARKLVSELSGGEQQKVSLARALAQGASILLLDEPTTYLDAPSRLEIMETIHAMHHERELTTVMVSHEPDWVEQYADKVYLLKDGVARLAT